MIDTKTDMIGIVILNYNNDSDTIICIESILDNCKNSDYKLLVVDNGSEHAVKIKLQAYCENHVENNIFFLRSEENLGYARGNNLGIEYFNNDEKISHILILNNDILFNMDILNPLKRFIESTLDCAVVSPLLLSKSGEIDFECARKEKRTIDFIARTTLLGKIPFIKRIADKSMMLKGSSGLLTKEFIEIELPSGSCMLFKKEVLNKIGKFDVNTFLYFEEDILWSKIKSINMKSYLIPKLTSVHLGAQSTKKEGSYIIQKFHYESMVYFLNNYSKIPSLFIEFFKIRGKISLILKK
jgi:GT2 family glycosyltransferase